MISVGVEILRLVPLILAFYVPALLAVVLWREKGKNYRIKTALMATVGCGLIVAVQLTLGSASVAQVFQALALSLAQVAVALLLAYLTVYKIAD